MMVPQVLHVLLIWQQIVQVLGYSLPTKLMCQKRLGDTQAVCVVWPPAPKAELSLSVQQRWPATQT